MKKILIITVFIGSLITGLFANEDKDKIIGDWINNFPKCFSSEKNVSKNFKKFWAENDLGRHANVYILDYILGDIKRACSNWKMNKCLENSKVYYTDNPFMRLCSEESISLYEEGVNLKKEKY